MTAEPGLRERKKQQTRQLIFETAARLFADRGFDAVTVAEVARAADVSEVTVFNYYPTKEDLYFGGMEAFEARLVDAVRERPAGEPVLDAFARPIDTGFDNLLDPDRAPIIARSATLIAASPALQTREREVVARCTRALAHVLAAEAGVDEVDVEAWTVASALMSAHRALVAFVRSRVLAGVRGEQLVAEARAEADRAFARLMRGVGGYPPGD